MVKNGFSTSLKIHSICTIEPIRLFITKMGQQKGFRISGLFRIENIGSYCKKYT